MKKLITPLACLLLVGCATAPVEQSNDPLTGFSGAVLTVHGMSCPLCANNIDGRLNKVEGIEEVTINLKTGAVTAQFGPQQKPSRADIETAIKESGFTLHKLELLQ